MGSTVIPAQPGQTRRRPGSLLALAFSYLELSSMEASGTVASSPPKPAPYSPWFTVATHRLIMD
uniref:Uncharacterized protein n=1 Tax=Oryza brachyantha TaxID=4533 RepID=J3KWX3_ORYBR